MELRGTLQELMSIYRPEWYYRKRNEETLRGQVEKIKNKIAEGRATGENWNTPSRATMRSRRTNINRQ